MLHALVTQRRSALWTRLPSITAVRNASYAATGACAMASRAAASSTVFFSRYCAFDAAWMNRDTELGFEPVG